MGDPARFERLFRQHYGAIVAYCRRRLPPDAVDEVVGDVFTTTWLRFDAVDADRERAWLYGVARNKIKHRWRADGRRSSAEVSAAADAGRAIQAGAADPADRVSASDVLTRAAAQLSDSDRELLQLISWEQLDPAELAIVLDCSVNTVTVRVHRMRRRLLSRMDEMARTELQRECNQ